MWSWLRSAEFNKAKGSVGERLAGSPVTLKMGKAIWEGAALSSTAHKLLFIRCRWKTDVHRKTNFLVGWESTMWQNFPSIIFVCNVCLQECKQQKERGAGGKGDTSVKRQRPVSATPLAPHLAAAAPCPTPLIPVKPWSGNQRMSNQDFFSTIPFQTPT